VVNVGDYCDVSEIVSYQVISFLIQIYLTESLYQFFFDISRALNTFLRTEA
jgi:hypothetical protein